MNSRNLGSTTDKPQTQAHFSKGAQVTLEGGCLRTQDLLTTTSIFEYINRMIKYNQVLLKGAQAWV
jgi:hypothetical protein